MRTEVVGKTLPPGDDDVMSKRFNASLKTSWAWSMHPSPPTPSRVALPDEDAVRSRGMLAKILERGRVAGAGLGQDEVLQLCIIVGESEAVEHG